MMNHKFKELLIWQNAMDLVQLTYKLTVPFAKDEEFGLKGQLRRAAVSVASNIAEGSGRGSQKEFARFLSIAMGSLYELETQWIICERIGITNDTEVALKEIRVLQKMIFSFKRKLGE